MASSVLNKGDLLIVDDVLPNLRLLSNLLKDHGYKVRGVSNGQMALTAVQSAPPDLILLDINMPEMDGYEVCVQLKENEKTQSIPVIFISALDEVLDKVKAFAVGGVDYISKPFQAEEVLARVKTHLALRHLQVDLEQRVAERTAELAQTVEQLQTEIHERQRAEEAKTELETQLYQSQKMEALGRLAGGVAHDFNNILTVIIGIAELLQLKLYSREDVRVRAERMISAGERGVSLTRQLLAFSRRQVFEPQVLDLNKQIHEVEHMLYRLIGEDVALRTKLAEDLGRIKADPGQIDQVVINLVVNARDAMPEGGQLMVETDTVRIDEQEAQKHPDALEGDYVVVSVQDTGTGMDAETLERIFEPFFTTKGLGKGTGLGLATVHGIVSQSGGYIDVESTLGKGTRFCVYLPMVEGEVTVGTQTRVVPEDLDGTETILVVEDEEDLRVLLGQLLEHHGYRVLEASNSGEALLRCERYEGNIDMMLADVVMPQMNGSELAQRLKPLRPDMQVLFMSGYLDETVALREMDSFLLKPFNRQTLLEKIREALDDER